MFRHSLLILILLGLVCSSNAQIDNTISFRRMDARDIGSEQCTYQCWDKNGGCWFVADRGIIENNGYQSYFYRHDPSDSNTILNDTVHRIFSTGPEEIFISYATIPYITILNTTERTFEHHEMEFMKDESGQFKYAVTNIKPDHLGNVYVMSWGNGMQMYNRETGEFSNYSLALESDSKEYKSRPKDFVQIKGDEYLVAFFKQGKNERSFPIITNIVTGQNYEIPILDYVLIDPADPLRKKFHVAMQIINCVHVDANKNFWIGTYSGLFYLDNIKKELIRITNDDTDHRMNVVNIKSIVEVNGEMWCGSPNMGVVRVDMRNLKYNYIQSDPNNPTTLFNDRIVSMSTDQLGNLWICSEDGMVSVYSPMADRFKVHSWKEMGTKFTDRSEQVIPVNQMLVQSDGNVLISSEAGLQRFNPQLKKTVKRIDFLKNKGISRNVVTNFKFIGDSILLNIQGKLAYYYEEKDELTILTKKQVKGRNWKFLFRHSHPYKEPVYFLSNRLIQNYDLYRYNRSKGDMESFYTFPEGVKPKETFTFELASGRWMIHEFNGRFIIFDNEKLEHELYSPSQVETNFPDSTVRIAHVEGDRIFIGTEKGLYEFNEETKESVFINEKVGLRESEIVNAMKRDRLGRLWIALEKDIACWNETENKLDRFSSEDGLNVGAFLPAIGQRDNKGYLYFATMNGMLVFNPMSFDVPDMSLEVKPLNIRVQDSIIYDRNFSDANDLSFHWNDDEIAFEFYTNQIFQLVPHQFEYRIVEQGENWISNGKSNRIRFYDFPHGNYTLQVRATNGFKVTSEPYEIKFTIRTPFWLTWWFYAILAVIAGSAVWYYIKYRERALKKRQEILEQTVEDRTAEVVKQKQEAERQKSEAEHQKEIVEEKQQEITDSITYAKRIQDAILPSEELIQKFLPNAFVMYRPKDIVAGDFYWMEPISDDEVIFAVADCTGHGVPGAMVSVVCNNALNRTVREFKIKDPGKILDCTRELVIEQFDQAKSVKSVERDDTIKDGMDISICYLNKKTNKMFWAGANNPLWIIRNEELIEIKGNKQPIGKFEPSTDFATHEVEIEKDDRFYIFSDGYADQFGGEKGKKFKSSSLKKLFHSIHKKPIKVQLHSIEEQFDLWKGDYEQLDDVCVIGFQL